MEKKIERGITPPPSEGSLSNSEFKTERRKVLNWLNDLEQFMVWGVGKRASEVYKPLMRLKGLTHRSQLDCEIVLEWDYEQREDNVKVANKVGCLCREYDIPVSSFYSGNKSIHQTIYLNPVVDRNKFCMWLMLKSFGEEGYIHYHYGLDHAFMKSNHPMKLIGYPHDKTGKLYECLEFVPKVYEIPEQVLGEVDGIRFIQEKVIRAVKGGGVSFRWIEAIVTGGAGSLKDGHHRFISFVLAPYFLTVKGMNEGECVASIMDWAENKVGEGYIKTIVKHRVGKGWLPMRERKWREFVSEGGQ